MHNTKAQGPLDTVVNLEEAKDRVRLLEAQVEAQKRMLDEIRHANAAIRVRAEQARRVLRLFLEYAQETSFPEPGSDRFESLVSQAHIASQDGAGRAILASLKQNLLSMFRALGLRPAACRCGKSVFFLPLPNGKKVPVTEWAALHTRACPYHQQLREAKDDSSREAKEDGGAGHDPAPCA